MVAARDRACGSWRELLPVRATRGRGEPGRDRDAAGADRQGRRLGLGSNAPLVKDEGRLPTGSFKARGLVMAVSMAKALGVKKIAMPTNGNAGAAACRLCDALPGSRRSCLCPDDTPEINVREIAVQGARVYRVNGLIDDCGAIVGEGRAPNGCGSISRP
jgi:threonine synthase